MRQILANKTQKEFLRKSFRGLGSKNKKNAPLTTQALGTYLRYKSNTDMAKKVRKLALEKGCLFVASEEKVQEVCSHEESPKRMLITYAGRVSAVVDYAQNLFYIEVDGKREEESVSAIENGSKSFADWEDVKEKAKQRAALL